MSARLYHSSCLLLRKGDYTPVGSTQQLKTHHQIPEHTPESTCATETSLATVLQVMKSCLDLFSSFLTFFSAAIVCWIHCHLLVHVGTIESPFVFRRREVDQDPGSFHGMLLLIWSKSRRVQGLDHYSFQFTVRTGQNLVHTAACVRSFR